jgi:hypothetical protein
MTVGSSGALDLAAERRTKFTPPDALLCKFDQVLRPEVLRNFCAQICVQLIPAKLLRADLRATDTRETSARTFCEQSLRAANA